MHGKIVPEWADHREPVVRTMVLPEEKEEEIEEEEGEVMEQGSSEKGNVEQQTN